MLQTLSNYYVILISAHFGKHWSKGQLFFIDVSQE